MVRLRLRLEIIEILRHLACVHPVYRWCIDLRQPCLLLLDGYPLSLLFFLLLRTSLLGRVLLFLEIAVRMSDPGQGRVLRSQSRVVRDVQDSISVAPRKPRVDTALSD